MAVTDEERSEETVGPYTVRSFKKKGVRLACVSVYKNGNLIIDRPCLPSEVARFFASEFKRCRDKCAWIKGD